MSLGSTLSGFGTGIKLSDPIDFATMHVVFVPAGLFIFFLTLIMDIIKRTYVALCKWIMPAHSDSERAAAAGCCTSHSPCERSTMSSIIIGDRLIDPRLTPTKTLKR